MYDRAWSAFINMLSTSWLEVKLITAISAVGRSGEFQKSEKRPRYKPRPLFGLIPATTDSPTQFPAQYHGPWRA